MSNNQGQDQSILYPLIAIIAGMLGNIANFLANAEALYSTIGFLASTLLIGVGVIGIFVQQNRVKLKDGILYAVIWTLFIAFTGAGYYILISQPVIVYGRVLDNVNQRNPVSGVEVSLYHYDTGTTRQVLTDSNGEFRFGDVDDGEYDLIINGINIYSGDSPGGWNKLLAGDINAGRFYLENIAGGQNASVPPTATPTSLTPTNTDTFIPSTNTPIPPTVINTTIPTPIFTFTPTLTRTPRPTNTPRPPTNTPTLSPTSTDIPQELMLYEEDFEDGTADGWTADGGVWRIVEEEGGNHVYQGTGYFGRTFIGSPNWSNYAFTLQARSVANDGAFNIHFRSSDFFYGYVIDVNREGGGWIGIAKKVNNEWIGLRGENIPLQRRDWNTIYVAVNGTRIQVIVDGYELPIVIDETFRDGGIGLILSDTGPIQVDDIRVWSLDAND